MDKKLKVCLSNYICPTSNKFVGRNILKTETVWHKKETGPTINNHD